ncbi:hypothetical protein AAFF_G00294880 [Aldrovandia affinis]|uniref:Ependymin n=1 Tax=Aldrovandia affinis TaxID=143900 RepID=A0AAD7R8W1_9TELE|nr:hypothetical protein AAFF_G00294880 [Aldrovandia affinis]
MRVSVLAFICLCLALHTGAHTPPCRPALPLAGGFSVLQLNENIWGIFGKYNYDAAGERLRFFEIGTHTNQTLQVDILMLFKEGTMYEINWKNLSCKKEALGTAFQPAEIPLNARHLGQLTIGMASSPGQSLVANSWGGQVKELQVKYITSVTEPGCLPVSNLYHTKETGWMIASFNSHTVMEDLEVFSPPAFCQTAELTNRTSNFITVFSKDHSTYGLNLSFD